MHGLGRDVLLYESQHQSSQSNEGIGLWLPCSCRHSRARVYLGEGFVWGPKKRAGDLMDVGGVEDIILQCQIPTLGRNRFLLDVQIQDAGIIATTTLKMYSCQCQYVLEAKKGGKMRRL